jgi:hypothetical protein
VAKATEIAQQYGIELTVATDLLMIALGAAMTWNTTSPRIRNPLGEASEQRLAAHRRSVVTAVTALTGALTSPAGTQAHVLS